MEPHFHMRNRSDKNGMRQIQLIYHNKGKALKLDSGVKTMSYYWDEENQKISSRCKDIEQDHDALTKSLRSSKNKLEAIILAYKDEFHVYPPIDYVKEQYFKKAKEIESDSDVKVIMENWIESKFVKDKKIYKTVLYDLKELYPKVPLYFHMIDKPMFAKLMQLWLSKKIQNSTINKRLLCFKTFLREQHAEGVNKYIEFLTFKTGLTGVSKQLKLIPTEKEFHRLCNETITNPRWDRARDLYVIGCATGLRYSDLIRLNESNIIPIGKYKYIETNIEKTEEEEHMIPLNAVAEKFINKQFQQHKEKNAIRYISNWKLNKFLHELFADLGFTNIVKPPKKYGTETKRDPVLRSKAMCFHSSRRFFISLCVNSLKHRVSLGATMEWSGHKNLKTVQRYINKGFDQELEMRMLFNQFIPKKPQRKKAIT
jgi:integrase